MYGYRRGAIVLQKPPSFLERLLSGMGLGITQGVDRALKERERKREHSRSIIENFLTGKFPTTMAGTDLFQRYAERTGIADQPEVQSLIQAGREQFKIPERTVQTPSGGLVTMPGVTPPEVPFQQAQKVQAELESAVKLREFTAKEIIKRRVEKSFEDPEKSLADRLQIAWDTYNKAIDEEIPVEEVSITGPDGIRLNLQTHIEKLSKEQTDKASKTKDGIAYLNDWKEYNNMQTAITKAIHNYTMGKDVREGMSGDLLSLFNGLLPKKLTEQDLKKQLKNLMPLWNEKLRIQHKVLRKRIRSARDEDLALPPLRQYQMLDVINPDKLTGEIDRISSMNNMIIRALESKKEDEPPEPIKESEVRKVVITPTGKVRDVGNELETLTAQILSLGKINEQTQQVMTEDEAREAAKLILGIE